MLLTLPSPARTGRPRPAPRPAAGLLFRTVPLAGVLLAGLALRSWEWTGRGIWFDEAFTWRLVGFPLREMLARAAADNSPPLYYLALAGWVRVFGDSLAALRGLGVLLGLLTVAGMFGFAREAFEGRSARYRGLALFVAALTATSVFQVRYAGEVRPYALGAALAAATAWTLARATRPGPSAIGRWAAHGGVALLFAYTHYYALFGLAAEAVSVAGWLLARAGWRPAAVARLPELRHALLAGGVVAVGWLPWVPTFLAQRAQVQAAFWAVDAHGWTVPVLLHQMLADPQPVSGTPRRGAALAAAGCALGLAALARRGRGAEWFVLLSAAGPVALAVAASAAGTRTICLRYFLFAHLFLLAGVGLLVWRIPRPAVRHAVAAGLVLLSGGWTAKWLADLRLPHRPGARGAAEFIAGHRAPDELAVAASPYWYFPLAYHLGDDRVRGLDPGTPLPHYYGTAALRPGDLIPAADLPRATGRRLWVVDGKGGVWGKQEVPPPAGWVLRETHRFPEALRVGEAVVKVYERPAADLPPRPAGG